MVEGLMLRVSGFGFQDEGFPGWRILGSGFRMQVVCFTVDDYRFLEMWRNARNPCARDLDSDSGFRV
jgi:hypothetical protein